MTVFCFIKYMKPPPLNHPIICSIQTTVVSGSVVME